MVPVGYKNDLWTFDPSSGWKLINGNLGAGNSSGYFGIKGIFTSCAHTHTRTHAHTHTRTHRLWKCDHYTLRSAALQFLDGLTGHLLAVRRLRPPLQFCCNRYAAAVKHTHTHTHT